MAIKNSNDTKIIMMSPALMKLYNLYSLNNGIETQPITFHDPQECLEMLTDMEAENNAQEGPDPEQSSIRLEKQWGELELRLSFFTDACRWQ